MDLLLPSKIVYSKRKTLAIQINVDGDLIVRAPMRAKESEITAFITKHKDWIIEKRTKALTSKTEPLELKDGEEIIILENSYKLKIIDTDRVKIRGNEIIVPKVNSKDKLITKIKAVLKKYLLIRVKEVADMYNFSYSSVSVSSAKTNWGSCSHNDKLHFTYRLALCPLDVIDYIIVHELCHTKVKNHSIRFWKLVKSIMPNYKTFERWLKDNKSIMNLL
ncbi:MAG: M48 family metallopeptidase [Clostridiales bacterium]|nr:M48 family metallopeptidase [Clostridiales bacterium]